MSRNSFTNFCGHLLSIELNSPFEKENQCLESLLEFLRGNSNELYLASIFKKSPFSTKKTELLAVPLKILSSRIRKCHRGQRGKRILHNYQAKMLQKILPHLI